MNNCDTIYTVALVFILIAFIKPLDVFIARGLNMIDPQTALPKMSSKIIYALILISLFAGIYFLGLRKDCAKENFFFEVSKCNPKCSGAFYGKPTLWQFDSLSNEGTACEGGDCGYGMISNCKNPGCRSFMYGNGLYPSINPNMIREGV